MEYQHLVFEEFARKVSPAIRLFHVYHSDMNPVIPAEFAHAVYRFGHSMLDDDVARYNEDAATGAKTDNSLKLLDAFLNPPAFFAASKGQDPNAPNRRSTRRSRRPARSSWALRTRRATSSTSSSTETLRNNLLGLPLDLPTINMARAREAGIPPLNEVRRKIFASTHDGADGAVHGLVGLRPAPQAPGVADQLRRGLRQASDDHRRDDAATAKRAAAKNLVDRRPDRTRSVRRGGLHVQHRRMGANPDGSTTTGLDDVDLWVGGLGEVTNLFGGLLGSTFNYVFQNTLENLQDGDRLYYLNRTPGMNLRTQLEGNSFAELIQRNTDGTHTLKADVFATADCKFELRSHRSRADRRADAIPHRRLGPQRPEHGLRREPAAPAQARRHGPVPGSQHRRPDGINGQAVYNGTPGIDKVVGGNDNDTFWGGLGADIIEGNGGDDVTLGGEGNDVITDLDGADVLKGGDGNDAIDGGTGDDIILGGNGSDFTDGGSFDNETFAGPGNDFVQLGQGADAAFGDGGDDWMQGGSGQDLIQGDHAAPFFDDPARDRVPATRSWSARSARTTTTPRAATT